MAIGRHLVAGFENHDVAHHNVFTGHRCDISVAKHLHGHIVVHLIEHLKFFVGIHFHEETHESGKSDGDENAKRLKEHSCRLAKSHHFIARNANGKHQGHEQYFYKRVVEFLYELRPQRCLFGRSDQVSSMSFAARFHLIRCQSP